MTMESSHPIFLIDPPTPFDSLADKIAFRNEAIEMLAKYPGHPQWVEELRSIDESIEWSRKNDLK